MAIGADVGAHQDGQEKGAVTRRRSAQEFARFQCFGQRNKLA